MGSTPLYFFRREDKQLVGLAGVRLSDARTAETMGSRPSAAASARRRGLRFGPSFAQHRRIDRLRELLSRHPRGVTLVDLGRMLAVDRRTVRRYL